MFVLETFGPFLFISLKMAKTTESDKNGYFLLHICTIYKKIRLQKKKCHMFDIITPIPSHRGDPSYNQSHNIPLYRIVLYCTSLYLIVLHFGPFRYLVWPGYLTNGTYNKNKKYIKYNNNNKKKVMWYCTKKSQTFSRGLFKIGVERSRYK